MVFNKFTHLARPSLSKTLTHGYAQSVVAATQTSAQLPLAKHHKNKNGRPSTTQQNSPFSTLSSTSTVSSHASRLATEGSQHHDAGLKTYFEAWQKLHQHGGESKEWKQFQFPKAIEAKPQNASKDQSAGDDAALLSQAGQSGDRANGGRTLSSSAVDDIKKAEENGEDAAIAKVNEAIASVIEDIKNTAESEKVLLDSHGASPPPESALEESTQYKSSPSLKLEANVDTAPSSPPSLLAFDDSTAPTSEIPADLQKIYHLRDAQAYKDIPRAFELALSKGITPTAEAYDALLSSATHMSLGRNQLAPKALDIYADMLRRNVIPSQSFYTMLFQTLSHQALYASQVRRDLSDEIHRFRECEGSQSFLLPSKLTEYKMIAEDDAVSNAVAIFSTGTKTQTGMAFSAETYQLLIHACAQQQDIDGMVQIYQHMEQHKVKPISTVYPAMIQAFSSSGDVESATECYNEYRSLAIADDAGEYVIDGRSDADVYSALIKGFTACGKLEASQHFYDKILQSFSSSSEERLPQLTELENKISLDGLLRSHIDSKNFNAALDLIINNAVSPRSAATALSLLSVKAADESATEIAISSYHRLKMLEQPSSAVHIALLAMHIRTAQWHAASTIFHDLKLHSALSVAFLEPTAFYTTALMKQGHLKDALSHAQGIFSRLRALPGTDSSQLTDQIDEIIQAFGNIIVKHGASVSADASVKLLSIMIENGGLISSIAEQTLAGLGPEAVTNLAKQDLLLTLQVQAAVIANSSPRSDPSHSSRLDHLIELATKDPIPLDSKLLSLVDSAAERVASERSDIIEKWKSYKGTLQEASPVALNSLASPLVQTVMPSVEDSYDPYASSTDYRGSSIIIDELDNHRNARGLKEALNRFRNIRRAGRHPRYIVYAKLISSAAKEGRTNLTHDILGMARTDVPYLVEYPVVRHGWSAILDAMVGACLTGGKRGLADQYHREMLDIGVVPSANTYGLYITTLKASTKTFDEASEAVKVFQRALSEGVVPSSFLYNALIGKLGKARRIDDCLRYFQEMRAAGIRPTSVTYGTVVNALCRVSDERFAEELFDEMESMPNYKPRPAPYNSLMQYFLTTKRDSQRVLYYYDRMRSMKIEPTMHTYKLLIDTHATLEPINLSAAEGVIDQMKAQGLAPEAVHYASLIHAKGCVLHDLKGAKDTFDEAINCKDFPPQASLYQALFESMVANHRVADTEALLDLMSSQGVAMTPYIANTLIHGWAMEKSIGKSKAIFDAVGIENREPSTYESMTRAYLTAEDHKGALATIHEMLSRGYPSAVSNKIVELVGHGVNRAGSGSWPSVIT